MWMILNAIVKDEVLGLVDSLIGERARKASPVYSPLFPQNALDHACEKLLPTLTARTFTLPYLTLALE